MLIGTRRTGGACERRPLASARSCRSEPGTGALACSDWYTRPSWWPAWRCAATASLGLQSACGCQVSPAHLCNICVTFGITFSERRRRERVWQQRLKGSRRE
eukprot:415277-Prorocentrum_minimum.AAC.5